MKNTRNRIIMAFLLSYIVFTGFLVLNLLLYYNPIFNFLKFCSIIFDVISFVLIVFSTYFTINRYKNISNSVYNMIHIIYFILIVSTNYNIHFFNKISSIISFVAILCALIYTPIFYNKLYSIQNSAELVSPYETKKLIFEDANVLGGSTSFFSVFSFITIGLIFDFYIKHFVTLGIIIVVIGSIICCILNKIKYEILEEYNFLNYKKVVVLDSFMIIVAFLLIYLMYLFNIKIGPIPSIFLLIPLFDTNRKISKYAKMI